MKCDLCDREATVHEVRRRGGKKVERHLCEQCAAGQGIYVQPSQQPAMIGELLAQLGAGGPMSVAIQRRATPRCATCGLAYTEFRQSGLLGCPACYGAFESALGPLLERAHEGGCHHVGKVPRGALSRSSQGGRAILGDEKEHARRLALLQRQLDEAVKGEQYERAAMLRDEITRVTRMMSTRPGDDPI